MQFSRITGQDHAKNIFFRSVAEKRLGHALLLRGPEGTGRLAFANAIAQYVNCEKPAAGDSCGKCASCLKTSKGIHPDVRYIFPIFSKREQDKSFLSEDFLQQFRSKFFANPYYTLHEWSAELEAENKQLAIHIPEIRELKRKMSLKAFEGGYKVVVIWHAEKINNEAANSLLKLLEEPPEKSILILTTDNAELLPVTVLSRCQSILFRPNAGSDIAEYLQQAHAVPAVQANQIAGLADGSLSRAQGMISDAETSFSGLYFRWMRLCSVLDFNQLCDWTEEICSESREFQKLFLSFALHKLRDAMLFNFNADNLVRSSPEEMKFISGFSRYLNLKGSGHLRTLIEESLQYLSRNVNSQMVFLVLSMKIGSELKRGQTAVAASR